MQHLESVLSVKFALVALEMGSCSWPFGQVLPFLPDLHTVVEKSWKNILGSCLSFPAFELFKCGGTG